MTPDLPMPFIVYRSLIVYFFHIFSSFLPRQFLRVTSWKAPIFISVDRFKYVVSVEFGRLYNELFCSHITQVDITKN